MPAKRRMALRSQRMPNSSSRMPTTMWKLCFTSSWYTMSGVPKIPTITASVLRPPTTPQIGERQPRVFPTARTMVKASTHSTTLARKAGTAAMARVNRLALITLDSDFCSQRRHQWYLCGGQAFTQRTPGQLPVVASLANNLLVGGQFELVQNTVAEDLGPGRRALCLTVQPVLDGVRVG